MKLGNELCPVCGFKKTMILLNYQTTRHRKSVRVVAGVMCKICNSYYVWCGPNEYCTPKPVDLSDNYKIMRAKKGNLLLHGLGKINNAGEKII